MISCFVRWRVDAARARAAKAAWPLAERTDLPQVKPERSSDKAFRRAHPEETEEHCEDIYRGNTGVNTGIQVGSEVV
ncbi:hypothetical protein AB1J03_24280 [Vibrio diabolicus]|uniref:hypothetical protein n=1 Tax=Vibrio diabolicus TaxID=50719 RepID=UPI0034589276